MSNKIHPSAIIDSSAELGDNITIDQYATVEANTIIDNGCKIGAYASIKAYTRMAENNIIHNYACVGGEPQDLKFRGEESWLEIGSNNTFREFCTLHRGTEGGGGLTKIGNNNLFMAYTHVAHDCKVGSYIVLSNVATLAGHVEVQDYTIVGGVSAVHQFCRLGVHSFVGGMTGIGQDLPPYMLASGSRGGVFGPNLIGLRRIKASTQTVSALKQAFKLFWSDLSKNDALDQLNQEYPDILEIAEFAAFIRNSERGVLSRGITQ